jgi:ArsR family transcriptional regulator
MKKGTMSQAAVLFQAGVVRAVGHPLRIQMLMYIGGRQRQVSEIIEYLHTNAANVSRHLGILRRAGVLAARKQGRCVYYRVAMGSVLEFLEALGKTLERKISR